VVIIIMGVCGSGKSTIGEKLSEIMNFRFMEGDSFHSETNIKKMSMGEPLTEKEREPWLKSIRKEIDRNLEQRIQCVITCSALSRKSRGILGTNRAEIKLIYLYASQSILMNRMAKRKNHFMPADLLRSQFEVLEEPELSEALHVRVDMPAQEVTDFIIQELKKF
jgi:carbohydrate kinase (thermoresistant glucokinase family)